MTGAVEELRHHAELCTCSSTGRQAGRLRQLPAAVTFTTGARRRRWTSRKIQNVHSRQLINHSAAAVCFDIPHARARACTSFFVYRPPAVAVTSMLLLSSLPLSHFVACMASYRVVCVCVCVRGDIATVCMSVCLSHANFARKTYKKVAKFARFLYKKAQTVCVFRTKIAQIFTRFSPKNYTNFTPFSYKNRPFFARFFARNCAFL